MSGNLNVSMKLSLIDGVSGPVEGIIAELNKLTAAANKIDGDKGSTRISAWGSEVGSIRSVVAELGSLEGATVSAGSAASAASATSIGQYNQQLRSVSSIVAEVTALRTATAEAAAPIDVSIGKFNQEKASIEGVTAAMRQLGTATAQAAAGGRRPGDPINWGPKWNEPGGSGPAASQAREGYTKASDYFDEQAKREAERSPLIAESGGGLFGSMVRFAEMGSGYRLGKGSYEQAASAQSLDAGMDAAGFSADEIKRIDTVADELSRQKKVFSRNSIVGMMRDARTILGSTEHAVEAMSAVLDLATIVEAKHPGQGDGGAAALLKGIETSGSTTSIEQFNRRANTIAKVQNVFGATVGLDDWGQFFNRAGSAGSRLSEEFIGEDLPHLLQEMHSEQAGTMIRTLMRNTADLRMDKTARDTMADYGLIDPSKVDEKGHLLPGAFLHADEMQSNPYRFANQYLKPQFDARQLSNSEEEQVLNRMFSNPNTARAMSIFMRQSAIIEKDAVQIRGAKGLEAGPILATADPRLATTSIGAQVENFERQAGGPLVPWLTRFQSSIATGIGGINDVLGRLPGATTAAAGTIAAGAGYVGWKTAQQGVSTAGRMLGLGGAGEAAGAGAAGETAAAIGTTIGAAGAAAIAGGAAVMGGSIYGLSHVGARPGQRGRAEPPSENDTDRPGHWANGRFGLRQWVEDRGAGLSSGIVLPPTVLQAMAAPLTSAVAQALAGAQQRLQFQASPVATAPRSAPTVENNQRYVSAPVTVNAPISITATLSNTTPGAIGAAVGSAVRRAVRAGSSAALHDGPETK